MITPPPFGSSLTVDGNAADWFAELFAEFAEAYPSVRVREGTARRYAEALADLAPEEIKTAMGRAILEKRYFATVAELREYARGSVEDAPLLAWTGLLSAARRVGGFQSLEIEDAAAAEALLRVCGSWGSFCELEAGPAHHTKRNEFIAAYRDARRALPLRHGVQRLPGLCEASGQYERRLHGWIGRLSQSGEVTTVREQDALPEAQTVNQLTSGQQEQED